MWFNTRKYLPGNMAQDLQISLITHFHNFLHFNGATGGLLAKLTAQLSACTVMTAEDSWYIYTPAASVINQL